MKHHALALIGALLCVSAPAQLVVPSASELSFAAVAMTPVSIEAFSNADTVRLLP